jgi:hypothetical protein
MHDNPYRPPSASLDTRPTGESEQGAFARETSIVLAVAGMAVFWAVAILNAVPSRKLHLPTTISGLAFLVSVAAHVVGVAVVFAAPRGRRLLGALLNGGALVLIAGLVVFGLGRR